MTQVTLGSQAIAQTDLRTCATCPFYQSRQDGTDKGWCGLFNVFARENHKVTQDCINTITDEQTVAQEELNEYIEVQAEVVAPAKQPAIAVAQKDDIEIDSDFDPDFGIMYRVWRGYHLLGTFYRALGDGKWVAQPVSSTERPRCETPEQAQMTIIGVANNCLKASDKAA